MNLSLRIARRYLFAKKSTNAINIISGISVLGVAVGTAALVLVLSVFNGFEDLIMGMFNAFNPDVKVTPVSGKAFAVDSAKLYQLREIPGVDLVSQTLEEVAFFEHEGNQDFGILKGVDEYFAPVTGIDSMVREGTYQLRDGQRNLAVLGLGMRNKLSASADGFSSINVYMAKRKSTGFSSKPFRRKFFSPAGTFVVQQDFDSQYVLSNLAFVRELMNARGQVSALEINIDPRAAIALLIAQIREVLGPEFAVKGRYEQDEAFLKLMNLEKWMYYALFSLALILVAFNLIGSLWMIVLDKKKDIAILKSMGATEVTVRNIFLNEGLLLCLLGLAIGISVALALYVAQKTVGIITIPAGFIVDTYPISMRWPDLVVVSVTVIIIGLLASLPPALTASRVPAIIQEE